MKKGILVKDQSVEMTFEEAYKQFEGLRWKFFRCWRPKLPLRVENEDIMQEIDLAFWTAFEKYDSSRGACFMTYATLYLTSMFCKMSRNINGDKRKAILAATSLNAKAKDTDVKNEIMDIVGSDDFEEGLMLKLQIQQSINLLNDEGKKVIRMLTSGKNQIEVAKHIGKSQVHVSRIKQRFKKILSDNLEEICV